MILAQRQSGSKPWIPAFAGMTLIRFGIPDGWWV